MELKSLDTMIKLGCNLELKDAHEIKVYEDFCCWVQGINNPCMFSKAAVRDGNLSFYLSKVSMKDYTVVEATKYVHFLTEAVE